jgi:hypothetical protein
MKKLLDILEIIQTDLSVAMPVLLAAEGLTDYADYVLGMPRDESKTTCAIMYAPEITIDVTQRRLPICFYLQLCRIDYETSLKYVELLKNFANNYDSQKIGAVLVDNISIDILPLDREMNTDVYLLATYTEPLDSCDD